MSKNPQSIPSTASALAEVETYDAQYSDGHRQTRRRTLALHVRPLGLWFVVALAFSPGLWSLFGDAVQAGVKWLIVFLTG
jgi:hypothetical protein